MGERAQIESHEGPVQRHECSCNILDHPLQKCLTPIIGLEPTHAFLFSLAHQKKSVTILTVGGEEQGSRRVMRHLSLHRQSETVGTVAGTGPQLGLAL
jgi:hypothetical protein